MTAPNILSFSSLTAGQNLTVPVGTDLIVGLFFHNNAVNLGGVSMETVVNYSTICSIKKLKNPTIGILSCDQAGYFFCLREAQDVVGSHSGADASGRDQFSLAGGGGDLTLIIQRTSTTNHSILVDGVAATIDVDLTAGAVYGQVGHKESTANPIAFDIRDSGAGGAVLGDCAVVIPLYSTSGGNFLL